jgi:hypothetical protein
LLAVKSGFILFIKNYQFPSQINTLERERERERERSGQKQGPGELKLAKTHDQHKPEQGAEV